MLRNKICRNRNGRRPCAFFSVERTEIGSNKDCNNNKKHNGKGDIFELPEDKEGNPLGRSIMDERILCEYSRAICKQRNDNKIHQNQGREKKEYRQIYGNQPELDFGL